MAVFAVGVDPIETAPEAPRLLPRPRFVVSVEVGDFSVTSGEQQRRQQREQRQRQKIQHPLKRSERTDEKKNYLAATDETEGND